METAIEEAFVEISNGDVVPEVIISKGKTYIRIKNGLKNYSKGDLVRSRDGSPLGIAARDSTWRDDTIVVITDQSATL